MPENRSARRSPVPGDDPTASVPEADAVEQSTPASGDEDNGDWLDRAEEEVFGQASEADVLDQLQDVGEDDEDRR